MTYLYSPDDLESIGVDFIDDLETFDGKSLVSFGIREIDANLASIRPGDLVTLLARPSNHKTSLMVHLARRVALKHLAGECGPPLFITMESPIEELLVKNLAFSSGVNSWSIRNGDKSIDWSAIREANKQVSKCLPTYYIGLSLMRKQQQGMLCFDDVAVEITNLVTKSKIKPGAVFIDFLQRMYLRKGGTDRRLEINEIIQRIKDAAIWTGSPFIVASQVDRQLEKQRAGIGKLPPPAVPTIADGKESGNIEELSDLVFGLWYPYRQYKRGTQIPDTNHVVDKYLFYIKNLKQRYGEVGYQSWCRVDPTISDFSDL